MKRLIRWALKFLPRPLMQRMAGWLIPLWGLFLRGARFRCPICGRRFRKLLPYGYVKQRDNALCPSCLSLERHRLIWLWLERESDLLKSQPHLLHIAPEVCLMRHFKQNYRACPERYTTADLESPLAQLHFDVEQIPLPDQSYEVVICNHLLEHVSDDLRALRELWRILKPGGWGILLAPIDYRLTTTFEDDSITDPKERERLFGQYDHRRLYGCDYPERLRQGGFEVEEIDYATQLPAEERERYALGNFDRLYIVRKRG